MSNRGLRNLGLVILLWLLIGSYAAGQAWVPEKGEGTFSTSYNYVSSEGHFGKFGNREPEAAALAQSALFEVEYGITDKLALNVSLPIVNIKYADTNPSTAFLHGLFNQATQVLPAGYYQHGFLDDGSYHSAIQDFSIDARYKFRSRPFLLTPFVGVVIPSHDYAYVGESSPGRNLKEIHFGANVGRRLNPFFRKAYVQSQIAFAIPEKALNYRTHRINVLLELSYNLNRRFAVRGVGNWQHTFSGVGGLDELMTPELALTHERILRARYWHAGGGASFAINSKTEISADYISFISGQVTHYGKSFSIGVSRSFSLKRRDPSYFSPPKLREVQQ